MPSLANLNLPINTSVVDSLARMGAAMQNESVALPQDWRKQVIDICFESISTLNAMGTYCDGQRAERETAERKLLAERTARVVADSQLTLIKSIVTMGDDRD